MKSARGRATEDARELEDMDSALADQETLFTSNDETLSTKIV